MSEPSQSEIASTNCYRHPSVASGVSCQRCGNLICGQCMTAASVGHHCPDCVKKNSQRVIPARQLMGGFEVAGDPIATKTLIGLNVIVHVLSLIGLSNPDSSGALGQIESTGVLRTFEVSQGEWWRLLTAGFLHFGMLHLLFNMFMLWIFGSQMESQLGRVKFVLLYIGSLLAGSAAVTLLETPDTLARTAGASGAIYGLLGAYAMSAYAAGRNLWQEGIIGMIGIYVFITFAAPGISIGGHMGGLVGGLALGALFFLGRGDVSKWKQRDPMLIGGGALLTIVFAIAGVVFAQATF